MDRSNDRAGVQAERAEPDAPVVRRKLTEAQERKIRGLILKGTPDELGMPYSLWSKFAVRDLIITRIGIRLPNTTLGAYLRRWGFVPEKALRKAYNQRPTLIRHWVKHQYPLIAAQAKAQYGEVHWGDETPLHTTVETDPLVTTARDHAKPVPHSMISIMSNRGLVYWIALSGPLTTRVIIDLFRRSIEGRERKLFLIVPRDPLYDSRPVATWLAGHMDRIQVFQLPGTEEDPTYEQDRRGGRVRSHRQARTKDSASRNGTARVHAAEYPGQERIFGYRIARDGPSYDTSGPTSPEDQATT